MIVYLTSLVLMSILVWKLLSAIFFMRQVWFGNKPMSEIEKILQYIIYLPYIILRGLVKWMKKRM